LLIPISYSYKSGCKKDNKFSQLPSPIMVIWHHQLWWCRFGWEL